MQFDLYIINIIIKVKLIYKNTKCAVIFFVQWNTSYPILKEQLAHSRYHAETARKEFNRPERSMICSIFEK